MLKIDNKAVVDYLLNNREKYKKILLQAPDGLRNGLLKLNREINKEMPELEVYISGNRCFGACDISFHEGDILGVDLIIHFGHLKFPATKEQLAKAPGIPVKYFPVYDDGKINDELIDELVNKISIYSKIGLLFSVQYYSQFKILHEKLKEKGFDVYVGTSFVESMIDGQILGCEISAAKSIKDKVEAFLVISGGMFHALGVSLWTGLPTYLLDIPGNKVINVDKETIRIRNIIAFKIMEAKKINKFGILVSNKIFQYSMRNAKFILKKLSEMGKKGFIIIVDEISQDILTNFPDLEGFIQTACPRISIDDISSIDKIILNMEQIMILLGYKDFEEVYPWKERKAILEKI